MNGGFVVKMFVARLLVFLAAVVSDAEVGAQVGVAIIRPTFTSARPTCTRHSRAMLALAARS